MTGTPHPPFAIVVMGVAGAGKTTLGAALAARIGARFLDADDLHAAAAIAQMAGGVPLTDEDRWPWLARVGQAMRAVTDAGHPVVMACSALRRAYRDAIRDAVPEAVFVQAEAPEPVLAARLAHRPAHFMPAALLASQLALLEPLAPDEHGFAVDVDRPVAEAVAETVARLGDR